MTAPRTAGPTGGYAFKLVREGAGRRAIDVGRIRLGVTIGLFGIAFAVLAGRLVELTLFAEAEPRPTRVVAAKPEPGRAAIQDRNGLLLATNLTTASLYARPKAMLDVPGAAEKLARVLPEIDAASLTERLSGEKQFAWIKRHLTPRQQQEVNALGLPGIGLAPDHSRIYPQGALTAHVVGYVDPDSRGLAGIERSFDGALRRGEAAELSIDLRVQHALRDELLRSVERHQALAAAGLVMDIASGEILGMVSLPDFEPQRPGAAEREALFNRAALGVYEMGSTLKAFTTAMALELGATSLDHKFDARAPLQYARFSIRDDHPKNRWLSVSEVFVYSSNIGSARMAMDVGIARHRQFLGSLGLLEAVRLELLENGQPLVPRPWREINTLTIAFGHGLAITPVQLVAGYAALANGGIAVTPTLLKRTGPVEGRRVVSAETSVQMRRLMRAVVEQGTGKQAEAEGYLVGGKTGTAEKAGRGGYQRKALLSSFVGVFPADAPRFVILAVLDEPKGRKDTNGYATGGWTAAPAVARIVNRIAPVLGVMPTGRMPLDMLPPLIAPEAGAGGMFEEEPTRGPVHEIAAHGDQLATR